MKKRVIALTFLICLVLPLVSASFNLGNLSDNIKASYGRGENAQGWINISMTNEDFGVYLSSNYDGGANITSLLNSSTYSCQPSDCSRTYSASNPQSSEVFSLNPGQQNLIALVLDGNINSINSLSFSVTASNQPSCINPLKIDILNDGNYEPGLKNIGNDFSCVYGTGRGCFNGSLGTEDVYIGSTPYCENITLIDSGKFRLGAWIQKDATSTNPDDKLKMSLFDNTGEELADCNLSSPSTTGGELYCDVSYDNAKIQNFFVCVSAESQDVTKYFTEKETSDANACGFNALPGDQTEYHDYYIFASSASFENIGTVNYNDTSDPGLASHISDYVSAKYNNNCTGKCIIPISFSGQTAVNLNVFNLSFGYKSGAGIVNSKQFYNATNTQAKFSTGFAKIDLGNLNMTLPDVPGNYTLVLYLGSSQILSKNISVGNIPKITDLSPTVVPATISTKFTVNTDSSNITGYNWDFGDGSTAAATTVNYISHTYSALGNYNLSVQATDIYGNIISKIFTVSSVSPKDNVNITLKQYKDRVSSLTIQLNDLGWYKDDVAAELNLTSLQQQLNSLETQFYSTQNDSKYLEIMNELYALNIPISIKASGSTIPYFVDVNKINLDLLKNIGGGSFDSSNAQAYKEAITRWVEANFYMTLEFNYVLAYYDTGITPLLGAFKITLTPKSSVTDIIYAVIENPGVTMQSGSTQDAYASATFDTPPGEIVFTSQDLQVSDLNFYLSPRFSKLDLEALSTQCNYNGVCDSGETNANCPQDCRPWSLAWILWASLLAIAIIAYFILQHWYKVKYEGHLFKNRNDIYNILNFMSNAKSQGMSDSDISASLKNSGWSGEQINYVFKKMKGKGIMPFSFLNFFRNKENRYPIK